MRIFAALMFWFLTNSLCVRGQHPTTEKAVYIDTRISGFEDGSFEHPWLGGYDRSTHTYHLDETLRNPAKCPLAPARIILKAGVYWTRGSSHRWRDGIRGWAMREGWTIEGQGMDQTKILLTDVPPDKKQSVISTGDSDDIVNVNNAAVRDLTIDCNYTDLSYVHGPELTLQACILWGGTNLTIEGVRARGAAGMRMMKNRRDETFVLAIGNGSPKRRTVQGRNYLIANCVVEDVKGTGQCSAISFLAYGTAQGVARSNVVSFAGITRGGTYGFNAHNSVGVTFEDNRCYDAKRGFNQDSGRHPDDGDQQSCIRLRRNTFFVPYNGMAAFVWDSKDSFFEENEIWLEGEGAVGVILLGPSKVFQTLGANRWVVRNNTIYRREEVKNCQGFHFHFPFVDPPTGKQILSMPSQTILLNNYMANGISNVVPPKSAEYIAGNYILYSRKTAPGIPSAFGEDPNWDDALCP